MKRPSVKQSIKLQVGSNFQIYLGKTYDIPPHVKLLVKGVNVSLIYAINESPFETVNL